MESVLDDWDDCGPIMCGKFQFRQQCPKHRQHVEIDAFDGPVRPWCVSEHEMVISLQSRRQGTHDDVLEVGAAIGYEHVARSKPLGPIDAPIGAVGAVTGMSSMKWEKSSVTTSTYWKSCAASCVHLQVNR